VRVVHPVKTELARRGLTQVGFAPRVGVSAGVLSHVLNGHVSAWPSLRRRIAEELEIPETELFGTEAVAS